MGFLEIKADRRELLAAAAYFVTAGALARCGGDKPAKTPPSETSGNNNPPSLQVETPKPIPTTAAIEGISPDYQKFWTRYPEGTKIFDFEAVDSSGNARRFSEFAESPTILVINCMDGSGGFTQKLLPIFDSQLQKYSAGGLKAVFVEIPQLDCSADFSPSDFFRRIIHSKFPTTQVEVWIGDLNYLENIGPKIDPWTDPNSEEFSLYHLMRKGVPLVYYIGPGLKIEAEYRGGFDQLVFDQATAKFMKGK